MKCDVSHWSLKLLNLHAFWHLETALVSFHENKVFLKKKLINSKSSDEKKVIQPTSSLLLATADKTKCEYTQLSYV